jgi:hypothetical protein
MGLPFLISTASSPAGEPESPYLTLPYSYNVTGEPLGTTPEGWTKDVEDADNRLPTMQNSGYETGWNPFIKILFFDIDSSNSCKANFALPKPVDASGGFRASIWGTYSINTPASGYVGLTDKKNSDPGDNGIITCPRRASPYDYNRWGIVNGTWTLLSAHNLPQAGYWQRFQIEWKPATNKLWTALYGWGSGTASWGPYEDSCPAGLDTAFKEINYFNIICPKYGNIYSSEYSFAGLWIGSPTDDWPTTASFFA